MDMLSDFEWCCEMVLDVVKRSEANDAAWEDFIIRLVVETKLHSSWGYRESWAVRSRQDRTTLIYYVIEHLIQMNRIHAAPGKEQATGRRLLRLTNVLDSIAQSL
jgi:hypothetical protein